MRILWVKMGGLWPATTGGRVRSIRTLRELARRHDVSVITTHAPGDDPEGLSQQLSDCQCVTSIPYVPPKRGSASFPAAVARSWFSRYPVDLWKWQVPEVQRQVRESIRNGRVDLCVSDFLFASVNVPMGGDVPVVLFEHNVEYMIWQRLCALETHPLRRALFEIEWRKLRAREADACRRADLTIAVSEHDRDRLQALAPGIRAAAIPTGVDTRYFSPNGFHEVPMRLVFCGSMDWHPNEDAAVHFVDAMLPRIRAEVPDVTFSIIGRNPSARVRALAEVPGVSVTGTLDDVRPAIAEGAVYVVPLRAGGGTRLKIFEALAMGKAVVSTTVGAEGLELDPGRHFIAADGAAPFSEAVIALLKDPARRRALGYEGRTLVDAYYSWPTVARRFEELCEEVAAEHGYVRGRAASGAHLPRERSTRSRGAGVVAGEHADIGWTHHHPGQQPRPVEGRTA
jgi:glycosyltransferase involved in cell wall biosynthesis